MTAQFGVWPPAPINAKLIGRCIVNADGTLAFSSKYADGTPVFTSSALGTGSYQLTPGRPGLIAAPSLALTLLAGSAREIAGTGSLGVKTYAAGVATDNAFMAELFDN